MINDIKDLKALLKLCRSQGVDEIDLNGVKIKFGNLPREVSDTQSDYVPGELVNPYANFPSGELTPDQLAFYSAGGKPEDDPMNKEAI